MFPMGLLDLSQISR